MKILLKSNTPFEPSKMKTTTTQYVPDEERDKVIQKLLQLPENKVSISIEVFEAIFNAIGLVLSILVVLYHPSQTS